MPYSDLVYGQILVAKYISINMDKFKGCISLGDILELKYGKKMKMFSGVISFFICSSILGAQVGTMGYVFKTFLGTSSLVGIIIGFGTILLYSTSGGIKADIITDILQFFILIIGLSVLCVFGLNSVGGLNGVIEKVPSEYFNILNKTSLIGFVSMFASLAIGEMLTPPYVQKLLIGKSSKETTKATLLSGYASFLFFILTGTLGLIAYAYNPEMESTIVIPTLIKEILPVGISGVIISSMLAIVLSTADTFLNSASVSIVNDFYFPRKNKKISESNKLKAVRIANISTGIAAVAIALLVPNIFDILIFAYSFWAPTLLVPTIFALLNKNVGLFPIWCGIIIGITTMIIWNILYSGIYNVDGMVIGFLANLIITTVLWKNKRISYIKY